MDLEYVVDVEEERVVLAHFASFLSVSSWTAIIRRVDSRTRSFLVSFTGRMMRASPSVLTSSAVAFVMLSSSGIGRSMMSPRLLPTAESYLIMAPSWYVGTNDVPTGGAPLGSC